MGYDDGECGDAGGSERDSEMQILGGGYELDAVWSGCSSLAVDPGRLHLRLLRLQIWWRCFGIGAQRDHWPDLDPSEKMIERKCERNARPEQDSTRHARYLAHRDLGLLPARGCGDVKHGGEGCHCWLK